MASNGASPNGRDRLDDALATLIQNQAAFVASLRESERERAEIQRRHVQFERETADRFAKIESQMARIIAVLAEHGRILERLPEAVREKIRFKPPQ